MSLRPFALERYFAQHEFSARYVLCASDPETMPVRDLLALEPGSAERLAELRLGYTQSRGGPDLREAIASLYEHRDPERVLAHGGSEEPIYTFMHAVLRPGDRIVVQTPAYQSHYSVAEEIGAEVARWESDLSREGAPDLDALEALATPATRAILLTTPNNPTGYPFARAELDAVVAFARARGLYLFCDEVYLGTEREAPRLPAVCDLYERGISLGGMSKAYGLAGLRVGWICTSDRTLYERMAALKDYLTICNSAPSEFLAAIALRNAEALSERVRAICARNLDRLDAFFAERGDLFEWKRPRAGTTAFPRYLRGSSAAFCERLVREAGVMLLPSAAIEAGDERVRFGYGRENLPEALAALEAFTGRPSTGSG